MKELDGVLRRLQGSVGRSHVLGQPGRLDSGFMPPVVRYALRHIDPGEAGHRSQPGSGDHLTVGVTTSSTPDGSAAANCIGQSALTPADLGKNGQCALEVGKRVLMVDVAAVLQNERVGSKLLSQGKRDLVKGDEHIRIRRTGFKGHV